MTEPKTASEYLDRGCDKDDKKDFKGAIEDYTKAIELKPKYAEAYYNRGCAKEELGDKEGAIADLQKAADLGDMQAANWIREVTNDPKVYPSFEFTDNDKLEFYNNNKGFFLDYYDEDIFNNIVEKATKLPIDDSKEYPDIAKVALVDDCINEVLKKTNQPPKTLLKILEVLDSRSNSESFSDPERVCKGEQLKEVMGDLKQKYDSEPETVAIALGYKNSDEEPLLEAFKKALEEAGIGNPTWENYEIWEGRLIKQDGNHGGTVFIPKRCVDEDPDGYAKAKLKLMYEEELEDYGFTEPMMCTEVSMHRYLNPATLYDDEDAEDSWFSDSEIAEYYGINEMDAHEDSNWHDG